MEEVTGPSTLAPRWLARWPAALGLFAAANLLGLAGLYFHHYGRLEPVGVALAVLALPVATAAAVLPWAGLWALAGRMLRQKPHFWAHVSIPLAAFVGYTLLDLAVNMGFFALDMDRALIGISALLIWALGVWALGAHLHWVSTRSFRSIWLWAFLTVTGLCGLFAGLGYLFMKTFGAQPEMPVSLSPYFLRLVPPRSPEDHLAPLARLQKKADREAQALADDLR